MFGGTNSKSSVTPFDISTILTSWGGGYVFRDF